MEGARYLAACLVMAGGIGLWATPQWQAPKELTFGELVPLVLQEDDPTAPPIPRVAEEKLGSVAIRSVEPLPEGNGWRFMVQAFQPGMALIPATDLGDGRKTPELRVLVPRTVPYGSPWMGIGGGQDDILPYIPFPWAWTSVLLLPLLPLLWMGFRGWQKGSHYRHLKQAKRQFARYWPPSSQQRPVLDASHHAGRTLLAMRFGEEARSWGSREFKARQLEPWATWVDSLDAARFAKENPSFPPLGELYQTLEERK